MERNQNAQIQETPICKRCTSFYANPKFGEFCSKCYKDVASENPMKVEAKAQAEVKQEEKNIGDCCGHEKEKSEEKVVKPERPVQVRFLLCFGRSKACNIFFSG